MKSQFFRGMRDGIPIALGYLSVSFGFGITAVRAGLSLTAASVISAVNLTSAGQAAGVAIMAAGGSYLEMALTQFVINLRYGLMSISLSQKLDSSFTMPHRLLAAYGITDEIFAVASSQKDRLTPGYLYGMILIASCCWTLGTFLGAAAGEMLPPSLSGAMGLMLYAMFIAIVIPPAKKSRNVLTVAVTAALCAMVFRYALPQVTGGFAVIISAAASAAVGALVFPLPDEADGTEVPS